MVIPRSLVDSQAGQIEKARYIWKRDGGHDVAGVYLPGALTLKFRAAAKGFAW